MSLKKAVSQKASRDSEAKAQSIKDVTEEQMVRVNFLIPKSVQKAFKARALQDDVSMSELMNKWVNEYINK